VVASSYMERLAGCLVSSLGRLCPTPSAGGVTAHPIAAETGQITQIPDRPFAGLRRPTLGRASLYLLKGISSDTNVGTPLLLKLHYPYDRARVNHSDTL
jgi:hypothetical protein